jgi:hypothetical protein
MPIPKLEITNPQALELIAKVKSGEIIEPLKIWVIKHKWYLISGAGVFVLMIALLIGKVLSEKGATPVFTPPDIESVYPTTSTIIKSDFQGLKEEIQNLNTDLPDPYIPSFDNAIDLEPQRYNE